MRNHPPVAAVRRLGSSARKLLFLALVFAMAIVAPARAWSQSPAVTAQGTTAGAGDGSWPSDPNQPAVIISPESGGTVPGLRVGDSIIFPPRAVTSNVDVTLQRPDALPIQMVSDQVLLDRFTLTAVNPDGSAHARFNAAWHANLAFGGCDPVRDCPWQTVDEASVRCLRLDLTSGDWLTEESVADVLGDRLYCSSRYAGTFVIVGDLLESTGVETGVAVYLPLAIQQAP